MKKGIVFLCAVLTCLLLCLTACQAEEAEDITSWCKFTASYIAFKTTRLADRNYGTCFATGKDRHSYLEARAQGGDTIHGLYVCFGDTPQPWAVQVKHNGNWVTVYEDEGAYAHQYVPLESAETSVRITLTSSKAAVLTISELYLFGEGDVPDYVQRWEPTVEDADLMVLTAHPDDEMLYFGGAIPYYAGERQMNTLVVYMTASSQRRSELLDGLWAMGVHTYPLLAGFDDLFSMTLKEGYGVWNGKDKVHKYLTDVICRYKPEVIVSHDVNGEYGHGAHLVCADAIQSCVAQAADTWQVQKLYLHLYPENAIEMDWDIPLDYFGGKTAFEMAEAGFAAHVSQHEAKQYSPGTGKMEFFAVEPRSSSFSSYKFGLVFSSVGPDEACNDFFEHVTFAE